MVTKTQTKTLTLPDLINRFISSRRYLSPRTVDYYRRCLSGLEYYARQQDWPPAAGDVTREQIRDFLDYLGAEPHRWDGDGRRATYKPASMATVHHYAKVIKTLFNWALDEEYLQKSPTLRMRLPRPGYRQIEPYSDEEVQTLLALCDADAQQRYRYLGLRNKAIIAIFVDTGLRLSELAKMRLSELDPQLRQVRVMGKGSKMRVVPISGEARKALKRYLTQARKPGGDELWQTDSGQPLASYSIKIMLARLKRRAGIDSGGGAHRFRHYFATRCLENGMEMNSLRLLLGHATLFMVLHYTKFVNVQRALAGHGEFSPLDSLLHGPHNKPAEDGWGWQQ